jgi:hypothetical protein
MNLDNYTSIFPFEFCATRFLRQWEKREKSLYTEISSEPTNESIVEALSYFQVARNFKGLSKDNNVAGKIRTALIKVRSDSSLSEPIENVEALTASIKADFDRYNLSASSKLLWLSFRDPFVIYDNRAIKALKQKTKHKTITNNYKDFVEAWRSEYVTHEKAIEAAIKKLPNGRAFMPRTLLTDSELIGLSKEKWFKERVFDIFLWEIGREG